MRGPEVYSVQAVVKAIDLLEALAQTADGSSIDVLKKKLGLSQGKAFRLLATLENKGLVERNKKNNTYTLGLHAFGMAQHILKSDSPTSIAHPVMFDLAQQIMKSDNLIKMAHPMMVELARKLDEAVYFTVLNDDEVLFLDMVDSFQNIKTADFVGKRFPFFTNAAGKVIRSVSSINFFGRKGKKSGIKNPEVLELELEEIRRKGFAVDFNGMGEGICSVAVVIRDYAGKVVGALTLLAPSFRMLQDRLDDVVIPCMLESAEALSIKFGYTRAYA